MRKLMVAIIAASVLAGLAFVWWDDDSRDDRDVSADAVLLPQLDADPGEYARAIEPYAWDFPADHGPHPAFQTEWWYYTGNLVDATGRRFGYQFTIFRRAIAPDAYASESEWRTNQLYMAHVTITDIEDEQFLQRQRFSRGGAGLAGAQGVPQYRVWLENWVVSAQDEDTVSTIEAAWDDAAISLTLEQIKPPALQGDAGLSPKSGEPGNASYYYSLSRLLTRGTLTIDGTTFRVEGTSWMDHEFSTSALGNRAQGWDWFGLHFDDGRDMMLGQIRLIDGGIEPVFGGLLVQQDGETRYLPSDSFTIEVLDTWPSPVTGTEYPAGWRITVDVGQGDPLSLTLMPLLADQELVEGAVIYWEGAVRITGDASGYGYAELTGYESTMRGRF